MIVLVTGSSGFIGRHLTEALRARGHCVIEVRRRVSDSARQVEADFTRDLRPEAWIAKLANVDCVINAVGILRERGDQTFERIHALAPSALFEACARAGVRRVIQISALGADSGTSGYFASKHAADEHLAKLPLDYTIVQPSVVYGHGGTSARLFSMLASLPLVPLPGAGRQLLQPIHIDDLVDSLVRLVEQSEPLPRRIPLVGPSPLPLRDFLQRLRRAMGLKPTWFLPIPIAFMRIGATLAQISPRSLLDRETLAMLEAGNIADADATRRLLGREPRDVDTFVDANQQSLIAGEARLSWLLPLLRFSIAAVWIWTGIVSLGLFPVEESYALLDRVGVPRSLAPVMLYAAAALDLAFGILMLVLAQRRPLYLLQIAVILGYTAIISWRLPEFWLHPYGPILKNLPMLAGIYLLYVMEERLTVDGQSERVGV